MSVAKSQSPAGQKHHCHQGHSSFFFFQDHWFLCFPCLCWSLVLTVTRKRIDLVQPFVNKSLFFLFPSTPSVAFVLLPTCFGFLFFCAKRIVHYFFFYLSFLLFFMRVFLSLRFTEKEEREREREEGERERERERVWERDLELGSTRSAKKKKMQADCS